MTTSPARTRSAPSTASASTTPTPAPARSYSSGPSRPGCSAVSPPTSAQPAMRAALGDAADDLGDPLRDDLAAGDVVDHEQRLGAADHEVVDDHRRPGRGRSCRACPCAWAIVSLVPTPSVEVASSGLRVLGEVDARTARRSRRGRRPPRAGWRGRPWPSSARRRGRRPRCRRRRRRRSRRDVGVGHGRLSASSAPPATRSRSIPSGLAAIASVSLRRPLDALEHVLADQVRVGQLDRVVAGEAGRHSRCSGIVGRRDQPVERDVAERVGADRARGSRRRRGRWRSARPGRRSRCRRSTATCTGGEEMRTCTSSGAGLAQHPHQRALGVAAHDRVVDDDEPLAARCTSRSGLSLSRMPSWRMVCDGWMNVRPT